MGNRDIRGALVACLAIGSLLLAGCGGGNDGLSTTDSGDKVTGQVYSVKGELLAGVRISTDTDGQLATTDDQGRFGFGRNALHGGTLRFEKAGYTSQSVPLSSGGGMQDLRVTMRQRGPVVRIPAAENGFEFTDPLGARVIVPPGALVYFDQQGKATAVTGDVNLQVTPINVSDNDMLQAFPGAFSGTDINGNPADMILSYGTVEFRFTLPDGTPVNLAPGSTATIQIPVFVTKHPDGTPITVGETGQALWYLDESTGQWHQESDTGMIVQSANSPTGLALQADVAHFSWWNYDIARLISRNNQQTGGGACRTQINVVGIQGNTVRGRISATTTSTDMPRFASEYLSGNETFYLPIPAGVSITLTGYVESSHGLFKAPTRTFVGCEPGPNGLPLPQTISFAGAGPYAPEIRRFDAVVRPRFRKANNMYEIIDNEVTFYLDIWGAATHGSTIRAVETGATIGIAPERRSVTTRILADTTFELVAVNDASPTRKTLSVTYVPRSAPVAGTLYYYYNESTKEYTVGWQVDGADRIHFGYVDANDATMQSAVETGTATAQYGVGTVSIPANLPGSQDLYVQFDNQYGTTIRRVLAWNQCQAYGGEIPICGLFGAP